MNILEIKQKINELMFLLEIELKNNNYDFKHPRILEISKELDDWVLQLMKKKHQ